MNAVLSVRHLVKHFATADGRTVRAVDDVSFDLGAGEILGIVGESGCGKSTLARALLYLNPPDSGEIRLGDVDLAQCSRAGLKRARADLQMVFQDPFGSLNPRHTVGTIIAEPLIVHRRPNARARVRELLDLVGLPQNAAERLPHQFSGGQRQRIAIARALALSPRIIVADEAVSALDVSIQSQIINLLSELRAAFGLSMIFISHDLSVVRHLSDRVAVMYLGRFVEVAPAAALFADPRHPYTQALISAIPAPPAAAGRGIAKRARRVLPGEVPDPSQPPSGCRFHPRCFAAADICRASSPPLSQVGQSGADARLAACHFAMEGEGGRLTPSRAAPLAAAR